MAQEPTIKGSIRLRVMHARHLPLLTFLLVLLAVAGSLVVTTRDLPERIPTHFGAGGAPDGWMSGEGYFTYMFVFGVGFPIFVTLLIASAPRIAPHWMNVPNRDHWLAPARREELRAFLASHACWLGAATSLTAGAMHCLVMRATRLDPPRLETGPFLATLAIALAAYGLWGIVLCRRLRLPGDA